MKYGSFTSGGKERGKKTEEQKEVTKQSGQIIAGRTKSTQNGSGLFLFREPDGVDQLYRMLTS